MLALMLGSWVARHMSGVKVLQQSEELASTHMLVPNLRESTIRVSSAV